MAGQAFADKSADGFWKGACSLVSDPLVFRRVFGAWSTYTIAFDLNMMRPSEAVILSNAEFPKRPGDVETYLPAGYSVPHPAIYAFEVMTPGLPMRQENRWSPCAREHILRFEDGGRDTFNQFSRICRPLDVRSPDALRLPIAEEPMRDGRFSTGEPMRAARACDPILFPRSGGAGGLEPSKAFDLRAIRRRVPRRRARRATEPSGQGARR